MDLTQALSAFNTSGFANATTTFIYWLLGLTAIGVVTWWIWRELQYLKVKYVVRRVADNRVIVTIDRCRIIKKKGEPIKWKLKKLKDFVPVPPDEAIEITAFGRYFVEAYYTEQGEYVYIKDQFQTKKGDLGSLYPVQNTDKEFYIQQQQEGKKYDSKKLSEALLQLAPVMAIILILVLFMIFFDKVVGPTISMAEQLSSVSKNIIEAAQALSSCSQNIPIPN